MFSFLLLGHTKGYPKLMIDFVKVQKSSKIASNTAFLRTSYVLTFRRTHFLRKAVRFFISANCILNP
ncbi:hypothetical protein GS511_03300 [Leptospira borgpetersenii]|nr:hypothetical protein B1H38_02290 [Leptospira borgpetersenii serovar Ballum]QHE26109.1 hypothetical protein GS524_03295 [Leptospira borgpetersenii]QHE29413.1 hypothetical protein GS523_03305 [Leptospira borgpetersenii]QHE32714.1 hypothetical protein GS517_03295 [Leptospira borgpetersenii]QHE35947.1 hypothetical protein GS510_02940 [Leptospira borgpetersenii]